MHPYHLSFLFWLFSLPLAAQTLNGASAAFEWSDARRQVLENHPLAQQADLFRDQATATLLRSKGGFDPKAYADMSSKNFSDQNYYRYTEAGVKLPSWLGLEFKGAYSLASGNFIDPSSKLPKNGQASFGFEWTLGQGLMIDERRAARRKALIGLQQSQAERDLALNDLLLDAAKAYWTWVLADNQLRIYEAALRQAELRNAAVREGFLQGERSAVDSLETYIQVQTRQLDVNFARLDLQNAALTLSNFLWDKDRRIIAPSTLPAAPALLNGPYPALAPQDVAQQLQRTGLQHPALLYYAAKLQSLDVDRRLKNEQRKPVLNLNYYLLGAGWTFFPTTGADGLGILANDIKWGVQFNYPLLNRKARGDVQLAQIKIAQTDLELRQKRQELETKQQQYANELNNLSGQVSLYQGIVENRRTLLEAENTRFTLGESSVFLVNAREQSWLDVQVKYLKILSEYRKAEAALRWAAGVID